MQSAAYRALFLATPFDIYHSFKLFQFDLARAPVWACLILFKDVEYRSQFPVERLDDCCQRYCRVVERLS